MYRITGYILPLIYILLFWGMWSAMKKGGLPVFDYSFFIMVAIFWAVYFLAKRNLFVPLAAVMERRRNFIAERSEKLAQAERNLQEARRTFDLRIKEVREEERAQVEDLQRRLSAERDRSIAALKADLQKELETHRAAMAAETEKIRAALEPEARRMAMDVVSKVLTS